MTCQTLDTIRVAHDDVSAEEPNRDGQMSWWVREFELACVHTVTKRDGTFKIE